MAAWAHAQCRKVPAPPTARLLNQENEVGPACFVDDLSTWPPIDGSGNHGCKALPVVQSCEGCGLIFFDCRFYDSIRNLLRCKHRTTPLGTGGFALSLEATPNDITP